MGCCLPGLKAGNPRNEIIRFSWEDRAFLGQVALDLGLKRRADRGETCVLRLSSLNQGSESGLSGMRIASLASAPTHDADPPTSLRSSPVYFTGLVQAAIFPVGGAVPALILGETRRSWERAPCTPPASRSLHGYPPRPCPAPRGYLALLPLLCVHPDGLVVPCGGRGAVTASVVGPSWVGCTQDWGLGEGQGHLRRTRVGLRWMNEWTRNRPQT